MEGISREVPSHLEFDKDNLKETFYLLLIETMSDYKLMNY